MKDREKNRKYARTDKKRQEGRKQRKEEPCYRHFPPMVRKFPAYRFLKGEGIPLQAATGNSILICALVKGNAPHPYKDRMGMS